MKDDDNTVPLLQPVEQQNTTPQDFSETPFEALIQKILREKIVQSTLYQEALNNPSIMQRLLIIRTITTYWLQKQTINGLKEKLQAKYHLNENLEPWVEHFEPLTREAKKWLDFFTITNIHTLQRNAYFYLPEIVYQEYRATIDKLPV